METKLAELATALRIKNQADSAIATIVGRPCERGHVGEYIASIIFDIDLETRANVKAIDGRFKRGALSGNTVNIKWFGKLEYILDICTQTPFPDYYLVLTGPESPPVSSRSHARPWTINYVFLFEHVSLVNFLTGKVKIGIATSVIKMLWDAAEAYPKPNNPLLTLGEAQRGMLALFDVKY